MLGLVMGRGCHGVSGMADRKPFGEVGGLSRASRRLGYTADLSGALQADLWSRIGAKRLDDEEDRIPRIPR